METEKNFCGLDELKFIGKNCDNEIDTSGMLIRARKLNLSIEEVYEKTMDMSQQEEHHASYKKAKDFLVLHAERFGLLISRDEEK